MFYLKMVETKEHILDFRFSFGVYQNNVKWWWRWTLVHNKYLYNPKSLPQQISFLSSMNWNLIIREFDNV